MAKQFAKLGSSHRNFIMRQRIFFTATATGQSRINVSPRSTDALRIPGDNAAVYLDLTGSGNETAAHLRADGRMTIMFCAVEGPPLIMRLYGHGRVIHHDHDEFRDLLSEIFGGKAPRDRRQMIRLDFDLVQTSCGFGVSLFDYRGERDSMERWIAAKSDADIENYWREKNLKSLDGLPTGLFDAGS